MSNKLRIKIKSNDLKPVVGSVGAAGMDLRADTNEMLVEAGVDYTFCTGVAIEIPEGYVGLVIPRSGMGTKKGMQLKNTTGVIDSDYRGYIKVTCSFTETFWLQKYERIVQLVIVPHYNLDNIDIVDELSDTSRGATGFGSSGRT
jgi:dUTP pyrophosphatase